MTQTDLLTALRGLRELSTTMHGFATAWAAERAAASGIEIFPADLASWADQLDALLAQIEGPGETERK